MLLSQHSCLMTVSAQGWLVEVVFRNLPTAYPCIKDSSSRPGHSEHVQIKSNAHLTGRERKVRESQTSSDFYIACILLLSINKFTFWFIEKKKKKPAFIHFGYYPRCKRANTHFCSTVSKRNYNKELYSSARIKCPRIRPLLYLLLCLPSSTFLSNGWV